MKTIQNIEVYNIEKYLGHYNFQEVLTRKLDNLNTDFSQDIINEIILWKLNRYVQMNIETFSLLNKIKKNDQKIDLKLTEQILLKLLNTKGIKLAMASTILRFKNPDIYQIIDQRVYRFIYGEPLKTSTKTKFEIQKYLDYLEKLKTVCSKYGIPFNQSDRIIYQMDKELNKDIKIKY